MSGRAEILKLARVLDREPDELAYLERIAVADLRAQIIEVLCGFVGPLSDDAVRTALAEMDDATLLRVGFVLEDKGRLPLLVSLLEPERLAGLIAAAEQELWVQDLLGHKLTERIARLPARRRLTLAQRAAHRGAIERLGLLGEAVAL